MAKLKLMPPEEFPAKVGPNTTQNDALWTGKRLGDKDGAETANDELVTKTIRFTYWLWVFTMLTDTAGLYESIAIDPKLSEEGRAHPQPELLEGPSPKD